MPAVDWLSSFNRIMLEIAVVALVVGIIVWVFLWWIGVLRY